MKQFLLWVATVLSILATMARALNVGAMASLYAASALAHFIMCVYEREQRTRLINGFYFAMALVACVRWQ